MYSVSETFRPELSFRARILSVDIDAEGHLHIEIDAGRINDSLGRLLKALYENKSREIVIGRYFRVVRKGQEM